MNKIITIIFLTLILSLKASDENIPLFIFAGQSIAINSGTDSGLLSLDLTKEQSNVLIYNARASGLYGQINSDVHWNLYKPPTGPGFNGGDSVYPNPKGSFGPEIITANYISKSLYGYSKVAIFKYAVGSSSLHYHYNSTYPGPLYKEMLSCLTNSINSLYLEKGYKANIAGIFWTQGESDAVDSYEFSQAYGVNLFNFVTSLRQLFNQPRLPFIYARITLPWLNSAGVRYGQGNLINLLKDVYMVNADDLITSTLHYNNEGTIELGKRYGLAHEYIMKQRNSLDISYNINKTINLKVIGLPSTIYVIEYTENTSQLKWNFLETIITDVNGFQDIINIPIGNTTRFYRMTTIQLYYNNKYIYNSYN